jgi:hypothetical protein
MESRRRPVLVGAQRAAGLVRDLFNVVREVNEWRHERDAFVAMYLDELRRRAGSDAHAKLPRGGPRAS